MILKIFKGMKNDIKNSYLVDIPLNLKIDGTFLAMKAIQRLTNDYRWNGFQVYQQIHDGEIPKNKRVYKLNELLV